MGKLLADRGIKGSASIADPERQGELWQSCFLRVLKPPAPLRRALDISCARRHSRTARHAARLSKRPRKGATGEPYSSWRSAVVPVGTRIQRCNVTRGGTATFVWRRVRITATQAKPARALVAAVTVVATWLLPHAVVAVGCGTTAADRVALCVARALPAAGTHDRASRGQAAAALAVVAASARSAELGATEGPRQGNTQSRCGDDHSETQDDDPPCCQMLDQTAHGTDCAIARACTQLGHRSV